MSTDQPRVVPRRDTRAGTDRRSGRPPLERDITASLAVAAFSIAVAAGFARVFSGWDFLRDLAVVVVVGHGVGLVLRRLSFSIWLAVPALAAVLVWVIAVLYFPDTLWFGLPTGSTWELFQLQVTGVREQFQSAVAPVVYGAGWDVLAAIGLAIAVLLADVFAFRAFARAETLVPGGVLFVFVGALGDDRLRVALTVTLIAVGVVTIAVLRSYDAPTAARTSSSTSLRRRWPAVIAVAVTVAALAGFVGPRLPGADAAPLYETRGRGGGGVTEVVSPLVDIRSRLTNRSDSELFEVRASAESYWRTSALAEFDGTIWGLPERTLQSTDDALGRPRSGAEELRQQITIVDLGGSLVPAAPDPFQASGPTDLRWVAETSTLVTVDNELELGDVIDVVSASPRFDPAVLAAASATDAGDPIFLQVPEDLPDVVAATAAQVTAGSASAYESAMLLQEWFRTEFEYSLEVQSGHGNNAIENFLRDRIGYCEQFAGTYAAMMRTLGIPARVAVGFTSGTQAEPGVYSVIGKNAHAWPEVWFDGVGWVAFEPTPGRGAPGAENYTGLEPQQDTSGADGSSGDTATVDVVPTTVPLGAVDQQFDPNIPDEFADPTGAEPSADEAASTDTTSNGRRLWLVVAVLAALVAAPAVVRRVRVRRSGSTEHQLARIWTRSIESLADAGVPVAASQTPLETAAVTKVHFPMVSRPVALLADVVTTATYHPEGTAGFDEVGSYGSSTMRNCRHWATQIDRAVNESATVPERARRYFTDWG
jgi:transglutaminase-like putative cysteine protease